jgi:hypothetical protein
MPVFEEPEDEKSVVGRLLPVLRIFRAAPGAQVSLSTPATIQWWVLQRQAGKIGGTDPAFLLVSQHLRPATTL